MIQVPKQILLRVRTSHKQARSGYSGNRKDKSKNPVAAIGFFM